jgi:hypothetical protein
LSYSTQNEAGGPEIGGYLYGAGIDSAARRFTPQKSSPQAVDEAKPHEVVSPLPSSKLFAKRETNKVAASSDSYETQDSLPTRFSWANSVTTPRDMTKEKRNSAIGNTMARPQTPPRSPHHFHDPEETNTNDEIASWGESVSTSRTVLLSLS